MQQGRYIFARPRQLGPVLYEDAPQELRSRLWMALLADPSLTGNLQAERVSACLVCPLYPSLDAERHPKTASFSK